jgi:hypothetical protein
VGYFHEELEVLEGGGREFPIVKEISEGSALGDLHHHRKLQGGKSDIMSHDATHSHARDMGPTAYERARQTAYTVKRLNFFKGFLVTFCRGN